MKVLSHLEGFISENIKVAKTFISLVKLEARLAGLSIFPLLLNLCMLIVITFGVWLSAMLLLQYFLQLWLGNYITSISLVFLFNLIIFFTLIKNVSLYLKRMSFAKTRESLNHQVRANHESTKTVADRNQDHE